MKGRWGDPVQRFLRNGYPAWQATMKYLPSLPSKMFLKWERSYRYLV
jgi:hypothetical protein